MNGLATQRIVIHQQSIVRDQPDVRRSGNPALDCGWSRNPVRIAGVTTHRQLRATSWQDNVSTSGGLTAPEA
jgi:hypothetical protein